MIYLVYGEEKYDVYKFLDSIKAKFEKLEQGINYFNITMENITELNNIYESVTFFGGNKLVVIKDTKLKFDIVKLIELSDKDDYYVIIEDIIDKRTTEYKLISKNAQIKEYKHLKEIEVVNYLVNMFKRYSLIMSREVAEYMVSTCSVDKANIINEMQKLVILLPKDSNITKEHIDSICSKTLNAKLFDMIEFAINKDKVKAVRILDELLESKEAVIKISLTLYKQIKQMYMIKYLQDKKVSNINEKLKINPYVYTKLAKSTSNYTLDKLKSIIFKFGEYDEKTKIGLMDFEIGLKQIICMM